MKTATSKLCDRCTQATVNEWGMFCDACEGWVDEQSRRDCSSRFQKREIEKWWKLVQGFQLGLSRAIENKKPIEHIERLKKEVETAQARYDKIALWSFENDPTVAGDE